MSFNKIKLGRVTFCFTGRSHHMLVVEQVHHTWRPLTHHHQVRRGLIEPQKTQGSWLFHTIHGISITHSYIIRQQVKVRFHPSPPGFRKKSETQFYYFYFSQPLLLVLNSPSHQDSRNFPGKSLSHLPASHICNTVECQTHEGGITAGKIILDGVVDQTNQLTVAVYQNWDEQVALQKHICQDMSN